MTIRASESFTFNGVDSATFGIVNVNIDGSGLLSEPFVASRTIREVKIRGRDRPYFQGIELEPLQFELSFAFEQTWNSELIREVARWLTSPTYYAPLTFSERPDQLFYGLVVDSSQLIHNGLSQGYITLTVRCDAPYSYSPVYTSLRLDYSSNAPEGTAYTFINEGDLPCSPLIEVELVDGDSFSVMNTSNGGDKLHFSGLTPGEVLTIDCQSESITTSLPLTYRYDNMSSDSEFIEMVRGHNHLIIHGNINMQWKYQFTFLQG